MPQPPFDRTGGSEGNKEMRESLHEGDNVIVVFTSKESSRGAFNIAVNLELTSAPVMPPSPWVRNYVAKTLIGL